MSPIHFKLDTSLPRKPVNEDVYLKWTMKDDIANLKECKEGLLVDNNKKIDPDIWVKKIDANNSNHNHAHNSCNGWHNTRETLEETFFWIIEDTWNKT